MHKTNSRRAFLEKGLKLGLILPFAGSQLLACKPKAAEEENGKKLKILILGGTSFLGPHQIAYALQRGHTVATFTRGHTEPVIYKDLFEQVTQLTGDRATDLSALENGEWDAVIDNSGQRVEWTQKSAALLKDKADIYLYTSSTGVFYPYLDSNIREDHPLVLTEPEGIDDEVIQLEYRYGVMKANSEIAAREAFGDHRTIVVRPTYMIGPADKSNRFIHWPVRLAKGGEVLVPGKPADPVQYVDVRDVAEWMIRLIEEKRAGTYNAVGPQQAQGVAEFAAEAAKAFDVQTSFIQVDDYDFLKSHQVTDLVPWIMPEGNNAGSALISNEKAIQAGLTFRSLRDSVKDTHDWWYSDNLTDEQRNKFEQNPETVLARESEILTAWAAYSPMK